MSELSEKCLTLLYDWIVGVYSPSVLCLNKCYLANIGLNISESRSGAQWLKTMKKYLLVGLALLSSSLVVRAEEDEVEGENGEEWEDNSIYKAVIESCSGWRLNKVLLCCQQYNLLIQFFSSLKSRISFILTSRVNLTELCSKRSLGRLQRQYSILSLGRRWRDLTLKNLTGNPSLPSLSQLSPQGWIIIHIILGRSWTRWWLPRGFLWRPSMMKFRAQYIVCMWLWYSTHCILFCEPLWRWWRTGVTTSPWPDAKLPRQILCGATEFYQIIRSDNKWKKVVCKIYILNVYTFSG